MYDLVIVGGGAAGLTAALYASRSGLDCIVLDPSSPEGSSIALTDAVENYTGFSDIAGFDLIQHFYSHAKSFGANFVRQSLVGIRKNYDGFILGQIIKSCLHKPLIVRVCKGCRLVNDKDWGIL